MSCIDGRAFILDAPKDVPALWGRGSEVLWAAGEGLVICGPQGVGKTTLAQRLALARAGVVEPELLGYPVTGAAGRVLYIAADRPQQIARSARRMVTEAHGVPLMERLIFWRGPLPFNLQREPERLLEWVAGLDGVSDVFIDSLKDLIPNLSSEDGGAAFNRAASFLIAAGIEVVTLHHQRKAKNENPRPNKLSDVFGSTWITSGQGSVLCLWGDAGDSLVDLTHLKQPVEAVGPLTIRHDHERGAVVAEKRADVDSVLRASPRGVTARACATEVYGAGCSRSDVERVRRRLEARVSEGQATKTERASTRSRAEVVYLPVFVNVPDDASELLTQAAV